MIERLCIQADLPKPRVGVMHSAMPNAFAMGRSPKTATVCATTVVLGWPLNLSSEATWSPCACVCATTSSYAETA